jgi:membrane peptidoglycan carboxypeptidase
MVCGVWLGNDDDTGTSLAGGTVPTQIWSDFMAKAHEGLTPQALPDASSAAVPASALASTDPLASIAADGSQPVDLTGASAAPTGQQPVAAKRSPKTIGDLLSGLFGGGG